MTLADLSILRGFVQNLVRYQARLMDYAMPPQCMACRVHIDHDGALCAPCWQAMDIIEAPFCQVHGIPFDFDPGDNMLSASAIADPPDYSRARVVARYAGPARDLVHALKYRDRMEIAPHLGRWMVRAGGELLTTGDIIIPVPLYRRRLWQRRFNQSAALAQSVAKIANISFDARSMRRTRATRAQIGLNTRQRKLNVQGAFAVHPDAVKRLRGAHVILVDDVVTTGATANACASTLLRAGAAQVDLLAFARVVDPQSLPL